MIKVNGMEGEISRLNIDALTDYPNLENNNWF